MTTTTLRTTTLRTTAAAALAALLLTGCGGDPAPSDAERREAEGAALDSAREPAADDPSTSPTPGSGDDAGDGGSPSASADQVDDDTPLRGDVRRQATRAALAEVGGGRVTEATYADGDEDHAFEVEVERGGDDDVTVELDRRFRVTQVED